MSPEHIIQISEINTDEQDEIDNLNYPETLLKIINIIRTQPQLYAEKVDYAVRYIKIENQIINDKITGQKKTISLYLLFLFCIIIFINFFFNYMDFSFI